LRTTARPLHCILAMLLTVLFVLTGIVGVVVLGIELGGAVRRRRSERQPREERHGRRD